MKGDTSLALHMVWTFIRVEHNLWQLLRLGITLFVTYFFSEVFNLYSNFVWSCVFYMFLVTFFIVFLKKFTASLCFWSYFIWDRIGKKLGCLSLTQNTLYKWLFGMLENKKNNTSSPDSGVVDQVIFWIRAKHTKELRACFTQQISQ